MNQWRFDKTSLPKPFDKNRAALAVEALPAGDENTTALVAAAAGNSDYLARIIRTNPEILGKLLAAQPDQAMAQICQTVENATAMPRDELMCVLRQQKKHAACLIALADIAGIWQLEAVMDANSRFADACVSATIQHLAQTIDGIKPEREGSGIVLIAMGKYGAFELNFSSDIDVIMFYDPEACIEPARANKIFPEAARAFTQILHAQTEKGYVFRVDLSLRPDPGTTPAAVSLPAAQQYYESVGQNWERAAFIKARFIAGDAALGKNFLDEMQQFIWRKYLDYAVLEDIHAMKRQAHAAGGDASEKPELDNLDIKRGAGGIRDIEMFVQSQQLIAGGRDQALRRRQTCTMLYRLAARKWITQKIANDLVDAYRFLRQVEHRLQMVGDAQTHRLPNNDEGWQHLACFTGFESVGALQKKLQAKMAIVRQHDAQLFRQAPSLAAETGALVFTGGEDDPETLESLRQMGFQQPQSITKTIRGWHAGHIRAAYAQRARELLTTLIPDLLKNLANTPDPDAAFLRIDKFFAALTTGVQFFALLQSNPALVSLISLICGSAPRLADDLAQNPRMMEAMLGETPENLTDDLTLELSNLASYEEILDAARVWVHEQQFRTGILILENKIDGLGAARQFSDIAEITILRLQQKVEEEFARTHGRIPNGEMSVLGAGSLGAQEMTILSDLDMIMIYQASDGVSDGAKPLPTKLYYTRLAQRLVQALTVPTAKGRLYEVDMRLRPSGNSGPVATSLDAFQTYQQNQAWLWEHMALTRMRPITGSTPLRQKIKIIIQQVLLKKRDPQNLKAEIDVMRQKIRTARASRGLWDISAAAGGLIDAEFLCQYFQLRYAADYPDSLSHSTIAAFEKITQTGIADLSAIAQAEAFFKQMVQLLHLSVGRVGADDDIPNRLRHLLQQAARVNDFAALKQKRDHHYAMVANAFRKYVEE